MAYAAHVGGQPEIWVVPWSAEHTEVSDSGRWQVSTGGGVQPAWRADGKELYYVAGNGKKMMAVPVDSDGRSFRAGTPIELFAVDLRSRMNIREYDVSPEGKRFLIPVPVATMEVPISVIINWHRLLDMK